MLYHNARTRQTNKPISFRHDALGTVRFSRQVDRGYAIEIWRRTLGVTVKRTLYNVMILGPNERKAAELKDFPSLQRARRAAKQWIDSASKTKADSCQRRWSADDLAGRATARRRSRGSSAK